MGVLPLTASMCESGVGCKKLVKEALGCLFDLLI